MDAAHEIFQKPFKVDIKLEDVKTPQNYKDWPGGTELPPTMKMWRVHADKLPDQNVGLVSDGYGFEDSPDCERISSGVNSKASGSIALGRQGNWFMWGFCASPSEMTESARRAFLNTIVYMKRFDGRAALVTKPTRSRQWAHFYAGRTYYKSEEERTSALKRLFTPRVIEKAGATAPEFKEYIKQNEGYLVWEEEPPSESKPDMWMPRVEIDQDAKMLGIENRDPKILDRCVSMLEAGDRGDVAVRVLERYTDQKHGSNAKAWRAWLEGARGRLYFTDTGGFKFRVKDAAVPESRKG